MIPPFASFSEPLSFRLTLTNASQRLARAKRDQEKEELDEEALVKDVRPLIESAYNILQETLGGIKALDPGGKVSQQSSRRAADHQATPEEQHLAESLATLTGEVTETIENAKNIIQDMPHAKGNLGPLLDALTRMFYRRVPSASFKLSSSLLRVNVTDDIISQT